MTTHSSIFAWRIPWRGESGRLQSTGSQRVRHDWSDLAHIAKNLEGGGKTGYKETDQQAPAIAWLQGSIAWTQQWQEKNLDGFSRLYEKRNNITEVFLGKGKNDSKVDCMFL